MKYYVQTNNDCGNFDENVLVKINGTIRRAGRGGPDPLGGVTYVNSREAAFDMIQEYARTLSGRKHFLIIPHELETLKLRNGICDAKTDHFIMDVEGHWCFIWYDQKEETFKDRFFFVHKGKYSD